MEGGALRRRCPKAGVSSPLQYLKRFPTFADPALRMLAKQITWELRLLFPVVTSERQNNQTSTRKKTHDNKTLLQIYCASCCASRFNHVHYRPCASLFDWRRGRYRYL